MSTHLSQLEQFRAKLGQILPLPNLQMSALQIFNFNPLCGIIFKGSFDKIAWATDAGKTILYNLRIYRFTETVRLVKLVSCKGEDLLGTRGRCL